MYLFFDILNTIDTFFMKVVSILPNRDMNAAWNPRDFVKRGTKIN